MVNLDLLTLRALVTVSRRSAREIGRETGWLGANLSSALKGNRKLPNEKKPALLRALGLDAEAQPLKGEVMPIKGDVYDHRHELIRVLKLWFPNGGSFIRVQATNSPGKSGLEALTLANRETTRLIYDHKGSARVALVANNVQDPHMYEENEIELFDTNALDKLGLVQAGGPIVVDMDTYKAITSGTLDPQKFDELVGRKDKPQLTWQDAIDFAKAKGLDPDRLIALLKAHQDQ